MYGRGKGDLRTCPNRSLGRYGKRIRGGVCASRVTLKKVRSFCNGKRSCNVIAKNNVFGDPCRGIFKYLRVQYRCKKGKGYLLHPSLFNTLSFSWKA